jgi:hypothetical protein
VRRVTPWAAVAKATRWSAWQARMPSPVGRCVLPVPGGPRNMTAGTVSGGELNQIISQLPSGYAVLFGKADLAG